VSILCERIIAVLAEAPEEDAALDYVDIAWHELDKRAMKLRSRRGRLARILLAHDQQLKHGAVLAEQLVVNVLPCESLVIEVPSATELAQAAYAIGNLHLPAEITGGRIILPADNSTEAALDRLGIAYRVELRRISPMRNILPQITVASELRREKIRNPRPIPAAG
jgi:urease accessory protein UreE